MVKDEFFPSANLGVDVEDAKRAGSLHERDPQVGENGGKFSELKSTFEHSEMRLETASESPWNAQASLFSNVCIKFCIVY